MVSCGVASEIAFGVIGLLGALIGGGVTIWITRMSYAEQRAAAQQLRRQHIADERRRACTTFLEHAEGFREQAWTLGIALDEGGDHEQVAKARIPYDAEWSSLKARNAGVQVAGPAAVAEAAKAYIGALGTYGQLLEDRAAAGPNTSVLRGTGQAFDDALARRDDFVTAAQRASAPDDAEATHER